MKKRYTYEQIIRAIKEQAGAKVEDICRDLGISNGSFLNRDREWKFENCCII